MTLQEIKDAVNAGKTVCWASDIYRVEKHHYRSTNEEQWLIHCLRNDNYIGLTGLDGVTMNGEPFEFYIKK